MSIKKYVRFIYCCDGPCDTVLDVAAVAVPAGWVTLELHSARHKDGVTPILARATYCPSCHERLKALTAVNGFTLPNFFKKSDNPNDESFQPLSPRCNNPGHPVVCDCQVPVDVSR